MLFLGCPFFRDIWKSEPERVFTDGLRPYGESLALTPFVAQKPQHIARAGIKKPDATNNRIERMNGTLRERVKVQRGWKTTQTPIAERQRIQYNFVKPHMALEGQTPAERAGVGIGSKNKWLAMLTEAVTRDATEGENHP